MSQQTFSLPYKHPFAPDKKYQKSVVYFSMEFAVDQALKIYSGGLGFLAGSHMRSVYALKQNLIGVGMLWKHGYYDQGRKKDGSMQPEFREKMYSFLVDTKIRFQIPVMGKDVWVAAYYLPPDVFQSAPLFLLTTDTDGNDDTTRAISYSLYDADVTYKVAQCMVLGIGGARLLEELSYEPQVYHFNEAHAVSAIFHLFKKYKKVAEVKKRVVFTTHTPEEAGNEKHDINFLEKLGFFSGLDLGTVRKISGIKDDTFNHSLAALSLSRKANGVSKLHGEVSRHMWKSHKNIAEIDHITNAQNNAYWIDSELESARIAKDSEKIAARKKELKKILFKTVADQCGKIFDPNVLTIVWARRFAAYKRPDMLIWDLERFRKMMENKEQPIQVIWAGKPYPKDDGAIDTFNHLFYQSHHFSNMAVLTGYELALSKLLKDGSDVWLNTPVVTREASGTSGMTAAMNASLNLSTFDGWICEFSKDGENSFLLPVAEGDDINKQDCDNLMQKLESTVIPTYYANQTKWQEMVLNSMNDVNVEFNSDRMAREYYEKLY
ncbi:alpha-glucan family phosphorylase [Dyadobacter fanqingshengii]|uniref:Alpha-glucan family phosphorylase n=1 Tax=Dyadobacter fanqingshengii TaxID=2906443 RepID=A0A9X1PEA1_9BACT|nr:alpha-glucan family phosphorylase [Dyadobacter fanqingshengii]MCF0042895.1 alpha-glucan family phosphorylase [Dyadobacter fanqingshengii]MCF2507010.1 alpha-glucan family phosphorylase [Dyadobacter fanqingshengii]USJ35451.1 alpha-glucan family phosphorylase [Dyadobacter fanqingshengii]